MAKKREIAGTVNDPTLPKTPVVIGGTTYNLCFTFGALAMAEHTINTALRGSGSKEQVNLMEALSELGMYNVCVLFAAGVHQFHPQLGFEEARRLVDFSNYHAVAQAVIDGFAAAMPALETPADPPQPGA